MIPQVVNRLSLSLWLCFGFFLYFSGGQTDASQKTPSILSLHLWPVEDWQHNAVTSAVQTRDGYLWFGTYHGLIRYDGARFTVFDGGNTPGLRNGIITSLYLDGNGVLWIGHETGEVTWMTQNTFKPLRPATPLPVGPVEGFAEDEQNQLWIWNDTGQMFRLGDGRTLQLAISGPMRKAGVSRGIDGRLWLAANQRVKRLAAGALEDAGVEPFASAYAVEAIRPSRDGGFWVLTTQSTRKFLNGNKVAEFPPASTTENSITATMETRRGTLIAGTSREGLVVMEPGQELRRFTRGQGLAHDWVRALSEDHEGNIWIGTAAGVNILRHRRVQMISPPDDWQGCSLLSFAVRRNDSIWLGTEGAGLYEFHEGRWNRYGLNEGLPNEYVWSVLETSAGQLLVSTWGAGVVSATGSGFQGAGDLGALTQPVPAMYQGTGGEIWIGTTAGLLRYESEKITLSIGKAELAFPDVRAITETSDGVLWFGMSGGGLGSWKNGELKQYGRSQGLASDFVLSLCPDSNGSLWIGTADSGLVFFREGKFLTIGLEQGLPDAVISHIVDDREGHLWLGSRQGIVRLSKFELQQIANRSLRVLRSITYGKAEGLNSAGISGGFQPGACRTKDGRLWFPTAKGLAVLNPTDFQINPHAPPVVIEELSADGRVMEMEARQATNSSSPRQIPPGRQRFEIRYTALSFASPDKVRFRYMLEGLEQDWIEAGSKRVAQYSYLPPGTYRFRVIACNNDNVWNEQGAALSFIVLPHFWQTWWFSTGTLIAAAGGLGGTVFWVSRRRIRRKLEVLERQRALERERARIARDIHDDLGASLTRITMLSQSVRADVQGLPATTGDVDQIYQTARELTRALDEIVWAVNPRHDTFDSLVTYLGRFAQAFLSSAGIRCRLDVPVQLPAWSLTSEIRHNLFLAFKESLNNIVKHARATEVRITLGLLAGGFLLEVIDNGCGFDASTKSRDEPSSYKPMGGNGLTNMCRRLDEVGGRCRWETAPGEGARILFEVHLDEARASSGSHQNT